MMMQFAIHSRQTDEFQEIIETKEIQRRSDLFLEKHLETHANKGRRHVSYISKTKCKEFIKLLAGKLFRKIISEIQEAKYFNSRLYT